MTGLVGMGNLVDFFLPLRLWGLVKGEVGLIMDELWVFGARAGQFGGRRPDVVRCGVLVYARVCSGTDAGGRTFKGSGGLGVPPS